MKKLIFVLFAFIGICSNAQQLLEVLDSFTNQTDDTSQKPDSSPNFMIGRNTWTCNPSTGNSEVTLLSPTGTRIGSFSVPKDKYILEAAEEKGYYLSYSGRTGADPSSLAFVEEGDVNNTEQIWLSMGALNRGYILLDTAYPCSDDVTIRVQMYHDVNFLNTNFEAWNMYWTVTGQ